MYFKCRVGLLSAYCSQAYQMCIWTAHLYALGSGSWCTQKQSSCPSSVAERFNAGFVIRRLLVQIQPPAILLLPSESWILSASAIKLLLFTVVLWSMALHKSFIHSFIHGVLTSSPNVHLSRSNMCGVLCASSQAVQELLARSLMAISRAVRRKVSELCI